METNENMENPNYFAIIPANVRYDDMLCANAKLLYGEITSLCNKEGYCWAKNSYFADLYKTTKKTISRWINILRDRGYIDVCMIRKEKSKEIDKRIIIISNKYPIDEIVNTPMDKLEDTICKNNNKVSTIEGYPMDKIKDTYRQKNQYPMDKNVQDNNTSINNTINNNIYSRVVDYLNQKTSKNFKSNSQKTQKLIHARLKEGFSLEDFQKVIDVKTKEWKNDKVMCKYLRPETLFGTKFEGYLNEIVEYTPNKDDDSFEEYKILERRFSNG